MVLEQPEDSQSEQLPACLGWKSMMFFSVCIRLRLSAMNTLSEAPLPRSSGDAGFVSPLCGCCERLYSFSGTDSRFKQCP